MALRKKAIKATINTDAEAQFEYLNEQGETCAIGGLARAAGVNDETLRAARSYFINTGKNNMRGDEADEYAALARIRRTIARRYGLTNRQQQEIQNANDAINKQEDRRAAIVALVETF